MNTPNKFYKHKLYEIKEDGTHFIILAEDYEHHKDYTEYLIKIVKKGNGDVDLYRRVMEAFNKPFWVRASQLMGLTIEIIGEGASIAVLYE